ncbi:MAG: methyltransferase domain-containing protein [Gammaproteobacteria bacterium]|nr:methyltransferase domain-containing protein [Gammaproteobacteria bacterium]NKB62951.1 methyltransferase domain-containing protein [Gammaproteobacteria bacterium]
MNDSKFDIEKIDSRLSSLYSSHEDKLAHYDSWADSYDSDLINDLDYVAHLTSSRTFLNIVPDRSSKILDVACGTGLVAEELRKMGYQNIDGTDFSSEMIRVSRARNLYTNLFQHDFTMPLERQPLYDAVICVGLFAFTVPGIANMFHVVEAVKPGGICVITVNGAAWKELNLGAAIEEESDKHGFDIEQVVCADYIRSENIDCRILVIRRPENR